MRSGSKIVAAGAAGRCPCRRRAPRLAALACALLLAACGGGSDPLDLAFSRPETALPYEVTVTGAPDEEIAALLEQSLALYRQQERGAASPAFLRRRAEGDIEIAQKILRSRGYYEATVTVDVTEPPEPPPPAEGQEPPPPPPAMARLMIEAGRPFTLTRHALLLEETGGTDPAPLDPSELGSPVGGVAAAAGIVGAEGAAVRALRGAGRPYAAFTGRQAVADMEAAGLEVTSAFATGPAYVFGPVSFSGAPNVDEDYLRTYLTWTEGAVFDMALLREYQQALFATGLFDGAAVRPPDSPPQGAAAPVTVTLEEGKFRSIALGARFSTDEGPGLRARFDHRNLFGANEQLGLLADATIDTQEAELTYLKPQYLRDGQDFVAGLALIRSTEDAFDELTATATAGLQRKLTERWTVGAGGLIEVSQIEGTEQDGTAILGGLPLYATYDSTDDKLDASTGQRLYLSAIPFGGVFDDEPTTFLSLEARGSAYQDLFGDKRLVLAERARLGSILASDNDLVPPTRRFFSGGGGSVRGYAQDFIGPLDSRNDPLGGLSVAELGLEMRARVWGDLGVAVFSEAGAVSDDTLPDFSQGLRLAAGIGLRYASPVGPIRLDVAFPIDARPVDDSFQAYIAIGQAF